MSQQKRRKIFFVLFTLVLIVSRTETSSDKVHIYLKKVEKAFPHVEQSSPFLYKILPPNLSTIQHPESSSHLLSKKELPVLSLQVTRSPSRLNSSHKELPSHQASKATVFKYAPPHAHAISGKCFSHFLHYILELQKGNQWALQMLDATTKLPDGILYGNFNHLGHYDECLDIRVTGAPGNSSFQGGYFRISLLLTLAADVSQQQGDFSLNNTYLNSPLTREIFWNILLGASATSAHNKSLLDAVVMSGAGAIQTPLTWSLCLPSSCSPEDAALIVQLFASPFLQNVLGLPVNVTAFAIPTQCFVEKDTPLEAGAWVVISLHGVVLLLLLASTILDHNNVNSHPLLLAFSLRKTCKELFATKPEKGTLGCLHGIRVGSILWVILAHRFSMGLIGQVSNTVEAFQDFDQVPLMTIVNGTVAVDSFFFLSGLLMCYVFFREMDRKDRFDVFQFYLYRYLRLVVPMMVVILFYMTLLPYIGEGPQWDLMEIQAVVCVKNWWVNMAYVNNYVDYVTACLPQTWYLSVDMQLAWFSPLVLLPLKYSPRAGIQLISLLALASSFFIFTLTYLYDYPWTTDVLNQAGVLDYLVNIYVPTHLRASPYFCGILVGYFLHQNKEKKVMISKMWVGVGWLFSTAVCLTIVYSLSIIYQPDYVYNNVAAAFYAGFHRLGWALGLSWIVIACVNGYGGLVNKILSWGPLQPLSKLTYGAYLTHVAIVLYDIGSQRSAKHFSYYISIRDFLADLPFVFAMAIYLYLTIEGPLMTMLKYAFNKNVGRVNNKK